MAIIKAKYKGAMHDVQVDDEDFPWLSQYTWYVSTQGYAVRPVRDSSSGQPTQVRMHREVVGAVLGDGLKVDHKDRNRLNNRRSNLAVGDQSQNMQNVPARKNTTSLERGVSYVKLRDKWRAEHKTPGTRWIRYFDTEAEAVEAVRARRLAILGYIDYPGESVNPTQALGSRTALTAVA